MYNYTVHVYMCRFPALLLQVVVHWVCILFDDILNVQLHVLVRRLIYMKETWCTMYSVYCWSGTIHLNSIGHKLCIHTFIHVIVSLP